MFAFHWKSLFEQIEGIIEEKKLHRAKMKMKIMEESTLKSCIHTDYMSLNFCPAFTIKIWNILPQLQSICSTFFQFIYLLAVVFRSGYIISSGRRIHTYLHFWNWNVKTTDNAQPYFYSTFRHFFTILNPRFQFISSAHIHLYSTESEES